MHLKENLSFVVLVDLMFKLNLRSTFSQDLESHDDAPSIYLNFV